jgi:hypothetical protein
MNNKKLLEALEYCETAGITKVVMAVPFQLSAHDALMLRKTPRCTGMILHHPPAEITASSTSQWLGSFNQPGLWQLPQARGALLFVGSDMLITRKMAVQALRDGHISIICKINGSYKQLPVARLLLWRAGQKLHNMIHTMPEDHAIRKTMNKAAKLRWAKALWLRFFRRQASVYRNSRSPVFSGEALYTEVLHRSLALAPEQRITPVMDRVVLVNSGLAAGGAERQIVNTLIGLNESGRCESVALLAEYLDYAPGLDFFLHELQASHIEVSQVQRALTVSDDGLSSLPRSVAEVVADLPYAIIEDVLMLAPIES